MKKLLLLIATMMSGALLFTAAPVLAQSTHFGVTSSDAACDALKDFNPNQKGCDGSSGRVNSLIKLAINIVSMIAGVIAVIMLIVSGFKYITSQGDATEISNAKKTLIYALAGLLVVVFAQAIVRFVLSESIRA